MKHAFLLVSLFIWFLLPSLASAQMIGLPSTGTPEEATVILPDPLTPEAINALVSRMSESDVRGLLLDQLHAKSEAQDA